MQYGSENQPVSYPRRVAVVSDGCTGCNACVDFCLVDCIEEAPAETLHGPSIQIRVEECIGCQLCAKVCDHLDVHAIRIVPIETLAVRDARPLAEVA